MLSILIPIYNQDVNKLVSQLIQQCEELKIEFLISVYDDKSTKKWKRINAPLNHTFKVNYLELSENLGRAKIRNWLAAAAPYKNLLFLDGDSGIVRDDFIKKYVKYIPQYDVVYGGTYYTTKPCRSTKRRLHWKYGLLKEALTPSQRQQNPAMSFHSNNFMIKADIFDQIKFDKSHDGYGYEDVMLAEQLMDAGYKIKHIDNPVQHHGLERTEDFLLKSEDAVKNLVLLQRKNRIGPTTLSKIYEKLSKFGLTRYLPFLYNRYQNLILRKLNDPNPSIKAFQFLKLYWYHKYKKGKQS